MLLAELGLSGTDSAISVGGEAGVVISRIVDENRLPQWFLSKVQNFSLCELCVLCERYFLLLFSYRVN